MADLLEWVAGEINRRQSIWDELRRRGGPLNVAPEIVRSLGLYNGMAGIYRDKANTERTDAREGVAITFLHTGRSYADELSADGLRYHYPSTSRPGMTDEGEIESGRTAHRLGIPVFISAATSKNSGTRDIHLGYIEECNDDLRVFLVTFVPEVEPLPAPDGLPGEPFQILGAQSATILGKVRRRPNQQRFALGVMHRYGKACAVCEISIPQVVQAAHVVPKSSKGSDDARNGLPLCANHHVTYDANLWAIDPSAAEIRTRPDGPSASALGILRADLLHLPALPHDDALAHAWARWSKALKTT